MLLTHAPTLSSRINQSGSSSRINQSGSSLHKLFPKMHRGRGRNCNLVSRTEGQKVPRCLTLTSPLSDSAIFLLRSMQRDECLIPISAGQNVSPIGKKRTDGGTSARLPPDKRPPYFYPPANKHPVYPLQKTVLQAKIMTTTQKLRQVLRLPGLLLRSAEGFPVQKFAARCRVFLVSIASAH